MSPAAKKVKSATNTPLRNGNNLKGKGKAIDYASPRNADVDAEDHASEDSASDAISESSSNQDVSEESTDTETEIALSHQPTKSKQTLKRKRRAIQPLSFGKALTSLLETDIPSSKSAGSSAVKSPGVHLLALNPSIARKQNDQRLENKARKQLAGEKKEHEHVSRVKDVIGGWGGESERSLRKVAQRGVVKLFNVIQQAQSATQTNAEQATHRGTGKPKLPAPSADGFAAGERRNKSKSKDNLIGRAKPVALGQEDFLQSIRAGGIVSKV